jgi:hypothetical protein
MSLNELDSGEQFSIHCLTVANLNNVQAVSLGGCSIKSSTPRLVFFPPTDYN